MQTLRRFATPINFGFTRNRLPYVLLIALTLSSAFGANASELPEYVEYDSPPVIWMSIDEQEGLKANPSIRNSETIRHLSELAKEGLERPPSPIATIRYEGLVSNHPERRETVTHLMDLNYIHALAWTYLISGDPAYAKRGAHYVSAWASTYLPSGNDVNENKLIGCFQAFQLFQEFIDPEEKRNIKTWIRTIANLHKEKWQVDTGSSNRHAKRLKIIFAASRILDDRELREFGISKTRILLNTALYPDGTTRDLERRDAMHYSVGVLRDLLDLSLIVRLQGMDLYNEITESGASLKACVEYTLPYVREEKVYPEWVNTKVEFDKKRWESGDPYYRPGKPWDPSESSKMLSMASLYDPSLLALAKKWTFATEDEDDDFVYLAISALLAN